ncbi:MAG: class I SAM-dependent methyltransferase [Acidobacteria bacterium]|nr:class I SAM-dependent methyltransferase [Acidobacteriota bacterium]
MSPTDRADFDFLLANARAGKALGLTSFIHLDQPAGLWGYIRIANAVAALVPSGRLLDWGCGFGQMTWLLRRRGLDVTPFDLGGDGEALPGIPLCEGLTVIRSTHPTELPFPGATFDAVLSCGVLEHVDEYSGTPGNEVRSLREIARVLRPGGLFLVFQLPQKRAWQEAMIRRFHLGYSHPRRFTAREIRRLLADTGFRVRRLRRFNFLPKNLTGMPEGVRRLYSRAARPILAADAALSRIPLLNRLAGVLEIVAVRGEGV